VFKGAIRTDTSVSTKQLTEKQKVKIMLTQFNAMGNGFWSHLEEAQRAKISSRQRYGQLMDELQSKGVAFQDIEAHMMNEAKRCGLYRKNHWSKTELVYMPVSLLAKRRINWYICLNNFLNWLRVNYASYDLTLKEKAKRDNSISQLKGEIAARQAAKSGTAIIRKTDERGNVSETIINVTGATIGQVTSEPVVEEEILADLREEQQQSITAPVSLAPELSLIQVQQVILQNFSVLGKIAQEKGASAVDAFNALMLELGMTEELL